MRNVLVAAGREIRAGLRNRWVLATTLLLVAVSTLAGVFIYRVQSEQ